MPTETELTALAAQDGYDEYYTEKLWNWIPGFYHQDDATTPSPGTLRAIIESMGGESAELRRKLDRIWENASVELADDVALEALGELVATRMVHALNRRARRVDVARTIYYRRRKGTPRVLESLITDMTGWAGAHLETRRRLARTYHLLEPAPNPLLATFTNTPRGGWANLRSQRIPALAWGAFEELAHTPDFRRHAGHRGRYGIPKVNVHLFRARAYAVKYPTIVEIGTLVDARKYALDPSGREVPLFTPANRPSADNWARMREWQVAKAMERRLLDHNEYEWTLAQLDEMLGDPLTQGEIDVLAKYAGWRVPNLRDLERLLASLAISLTPAEMVTFMHGTMITDCGRLQLYGDGQALSLAIGADNEVATNVTREQIQAGNLVEWGASWSLPVVFAVDKPDNVLVVDPDRGAVLSQSTDDVNNLLVAPVLHYGFPGEVGAGTYDRREGIESADPYMLEAGGDDPGPVTTMILDPSHAVEELQNNKTYEISADLANVADYRLQASNFHRPYLLISRPAAGGTVVWDISTPAEPGEYCLVLDGLWIGTQHSDAAPVEAPVVTPVEGKIRLSGTWKRVEISHCTLDPGGEQMRYDVGGTPTTKAIQYVTLEIEGFVEALIIDHSIVGPIVGTNADLDACAVGTLTIRDSIVITNSAVANVIDVPLGDLHIERSTVIGGVKGNRLYATDSLFTGAGTITDRQNGCFRFSAGVEGKWPRRYESHFFSTFNPAWLIGQTLGDPNLARLSEVAPLEIRAGAENHCEMGVWNHLFEAIKRTDLRAKLGEFMPFDLNMQLITED